MSTVNLPLWIDDGHMNDGIDRHPRLAKKLEKLGKKLDACEHPEEYSEIMFEIQKLRDKMMK